MLTEEQEKVLEMLFEADRQTSRDCRKPFSSRMVSYSGKSLYEVDHVGFTDKRIYIYPADLDELKLQGFIRYNGPVKFDITASGYKKYREIKERAGTPVEEIEKSILNYLEEPSLKQRYPKAYEKWAISAQALVSPEVEGLLTRIGHDCREAMQEFATGLIDRFKLPNADADKAHTKNRIKAVMDLNKDKLGETKHAFLEALIAYWGSISDLVQRQEHGAKKEREKLNCEDARRVVFHTAIVMYEIDRTLR